MVDVDTGSVKMCKCGKRSAEPDHTCPYDVDVNDDSESLCNCCDDCQQECGDNI